MLHLSHFLAPPADEVEALLFAHRLIFPGHEEESGLPREELLAIDRTALGAAWTVAEKLRAELLRRKKAARAAAAQQEAEGLLQLLRDRSPADRHDLITAFPHFRTCTLVARVCDASERAAGHLPGAALELARLRRAWICWKARVATIQDPLAEWRLLDLEASLRREQQQFGEALQLLKNARAACGDDPGAHGRILVKLSSILGDPSC